MINWKNQKEKLESLILNNATYEYIGKLYGCSGANIRKQAKKLGIQLPERRKKNPSETFNKGSGKKCRNCGKSLGKRHGIYCSDECRKEYQYNTLVKQWKNNEINGAGVDGTIRTFLRKYMLEKCNYKCKCGFNTNNPYTGLSILQIHHKDGDCFNNSEDNLEVLCPNCHGLTENFGSRNKNSTRVDRRTKYFKEKRSKNT